MLMKTIVVIRMMNLTRIMRIMSMKNDHDDDNDGDHEHEDEDYDVMMMMMTTIMMMSMTHAITMKTIMMVIIWRSQLRGRK